MSFTPAFLSLRQLATVLQEGKKYAAKAWLQRRHQDRQGWVDGMEAIALLVSGMTAVSTITSQSIRTISLGPPAAMN
jgi:aspartate aminotransferase-like enzyme